MGNKMDELLKKVCKYNIHLPTMAVQKIKSVSKLSKPNVAIIGWIGAFNLGDEMMLQTTLSFMEGRVNNISLLTCSSSMKQIERYKCVDIVPRSPLSNDAVKYVVKNNDVLWVNGGALIDDRWYDSKETLAYDIARLSHEFLQNKKKVIFYGVSCNSTLENKSAVNDFVDIINRATFFSVRDKYSYQILASLRGVNEKKISIVEDIVFANKHIYRSANRARLHDDKLTVGLIPVLNDDTQDYYKRVVGDLYRNHYPVRFILFCDDRDEELVRVRKIKEVLGASIVSNSDVVCPTNVHEFRECTDGVDVVLSSRYHGTMISNCMSIPTVCLNYDRHPHYKIKNDYLLHNYGFESQSLSMSDYSWDNLVKAIDNLNSSKVDAKCIYQKAKADLTKALGYI